MNIWDQILSEPLKRSILWESIFTESFTRNWVIKDAFLRALKIHLRKAVFHQLVIFVGDNPFSEKDLVALFRDCGIRAVGTKVNGDKAPVFQHAERIVVCVGASHSSGIFIRSNVRVPRGWRNSQSVSNKFVQVRKNEFQAECYCRTASVDVKLCTHENLFAWIVTGHEPTDVEAFTKGNYQNSFIFRDTTLFDALDLDSFPWPKTIVKSSEFQSKTIFLPEYSHGMFSALGYRVGKQGATTQCRREILTGLFLRAQLPELNSREYINEWGSADSAKRLKKMADSLAAFCRNEKRHKNHDYSHSILQREDDLRWLKSTFYIGRFDFEWPSI